MIDNDLEQIVVLRSHLEEWAQTLRWSYGHFAALDLSENYRQARSSLAKPSKLTNLTSRAHNRIQGYLNDELSEEESLQPNELI